MLNICDSINQVRQLTRLGPMRGIMYQTGYLALSGLPIKIMIEVQPIKTRVFERGIRTC